MSTEYDNFEDIKSQIFAVADKEGGATTGSPPGRRMSGDSRLAA